MENYYGRKNETRRKQTLEMMSKIFPGVENVEENEGIGDLVMHTLTTPIIEVAKDRETAQGVWMSVGLAARRTGWRTGLCGVLGAVCGGFRPGGRCLEDMAFPDPFGCDDQYPGQHGGRTR